MSLEALEKEIGDLKAEFGKFAEKGNNSAGTRARKVLQNIKKIAQKMRNDIQEARKAEAKAEKK